MSREGFRALNENKKRIRDLKMEKAKEYFTKNKIQFDDHYQGLLIQDKYIFSPKTNKWKNAGCHQWYRAKSPKHFYETYVNLSKEEQTYSYIKNKIRNGYVPIGFNKHRKVDEITQFFDTVVKWPMTLNSWYNLSEEKTNELKKLYAAKVLELTGEDIS